LGEEIGRLSPGTRDFHRFRARLARETSLFTELERAGALSEAGFVAGFEVEAWLVDPSCHPAPVNEALLEELQDPLVVPELSRFNVELNGTPQPLGPGALRRLELELDATWRRCLAAAQELRTSLVMIGILPTVMESELTLGNMSPRNRYHALNQQILRLRHGRPLRIHIEDAEVLDTAHPDVMLEAATTSMQIHLQVPASRAARFYNASVAASAPMVAAGANSPLLFGKLLWDETRIPLFEQSVEPVVATGEEGPADHRVSLGSGYVQSSLAELFRENLERHPVLLPIAFNDPEESFAHMRLHNGTIWRWNRPIVGFDPDGLPHLRIEHRILPSGPSIADQVANIALYLGIVNALACASRAPEETLPFSVARENLYAAARRGLDANLTWLNGRQVTARSLLLECLVPAAAEGLARFGLDSGETNRYLGVIRDRLHTGLHGAAWQREYFRSCGRDVFALTAAYLERQRSGLPVHQWRL